MKAALQLGTTEWVSRKTRVQDSFSFLDIMYKQIGANLSWDTIFRILKILIQSLYKVPQPYVLKK